MVLHLLLLLMLLFAVDIDIAGVAVVALGFDCCRWSYFRCRLLL